MDFNDELAAACAVDVDGVLVHRQAREARRLDDGDA